MATRPQHNVFLLLFVLVTALQTQKLCAQPFDYPTAKVPTRWTNGPNIPHTITYPDGSTIKALLLRSPEKPAFYGPSFAAGFYCRSSSPSSIPTTTVCRSNFVFGVFIVYTNSGGLITNPMQGIPHLVWSANRGRPVGENATLDLTASEGIVLKDADGSLVWTSGNGGSRMSMKELSIFSDGGLRLMDRPGSAAWSSFESPTDVLVPGQRLVEGQTLKANLSATSYWQDGQFYIRTVGNGFMAYANTTNGRPPRPYYFFNPAKSRPSAPVYMMLTNGTFSSYAQDGTVVGSISVPPGTTAQYLRLESDSQLRLYQWNDGPGWKPVANLINNWSGWTTDAELPSSVSSL